MAQVLTDFLVMGALYTLVAIGLSLVFSVMRIVNFAHAQMYMLGAYGTYLLYGQMRWPFVLAVPITAATVGAFGVACEFVIIRPVRQDPARAMISTLGLLLVLGGLALMVFGQNGRFAPEPLAGTVFALGSRIDPFQLADAGLATVVVGLLFSGLHFSRMGRALRAVAQDELGARLQGIDVGLIRTTGFAIGAALAALAGSLIMPLTTATPDMGNNILLDMFIIVVIGGLGSIWGAVVGAFVLALLQTVGVTYLGQFSILIVYLLVMLLLLVRPSGVLGYQST